MQPVSMRLKCTHLMAYQCPVCRECYQCDHEYKEIGGVWMVRCRNTESLSRAGFRVAHPTGAGVLG